ncbi:DUF2786 domain-containing protein [Ilumatobacter sp.]|uniref:DUF2786 domain-containing protein n=1 Tax=Ilumatobacter sp. TaxID=1967498 RepID=UPI003752B9E5
MTYDPTADLLVRVRKLLDKAEGTSNAHEADAFSRKAAQIIATHRIDPARLVEIDLSDELRVREFELGRGAYVRARLSLLQSVAEVHDVRVVFESRPDGTVAMAAGFRSDLDVVEVLYNSLHQQAASQMARERRGTPAATQRFRRSFLFGFAEKIRQTLRDSQAVAAGSVRAVDDSGRRELAVLSRNARIDDFAGTAFGRVRTARAPSAAQAGGWDAGSVAASRADVGRSRLSGRRSIGRGKQ